MRTTVPRLVLEPLPVPHEAPAEAVAGKPEEVFACEVCGLLGRPPRPRICPACGAGRGG